MNQTDLKLKNETSALVKDLELQIDYLVGYAPQGNHWKNEYYIRQALIDNTLLEAPKEIVDKLNRIQEALYNLRNNNKHEQGYIFYSEIDYIIERKIKINDGMTGETYFI